MKTTEAFSFSYEQYDQLEDLTPADASLLKAARQLTAKAYAPYSHFNVAAVAQFNDGTILEGTNQENASYPVGICAERSLLAAAGTIFPGKPIETMAISYENLRDQQHSDHPIAPCGMCRQALQEFEERTGQPVRLILSGQSGKILIIETVLNLLPLAFSGKVLK